MAGSILDYSRSSGLPLKERAMICALQQTAHDCALEALTGCREHLPEDQAVSAAIVGTMSALCRMIAESPQNDAMLHAVITMLPVETRHWLLSKQETA